MFVGRSQEVSALTELLARACSGNGSFVLVTGEAGIGKTRLAEELTRQADGQHLLCAWGRSWEGPGTPAYWPWAQVLRQLKRLPEAADAFDAPELRAVLEPHGAPLATSDAEQARFTLFERMASALHSVAERRPLLLVLDDIQAADAASLTLLRFVARLVNGSPVLLLATARDGAGAPQTSTLLSQVAREARHVGLGRLLQSDVDSWMKQSDVELAAAEVWQASEGNPLFVAELLAAAKKYPGAGVRRSQLPQGIREAIQAHLGLLPAPARRLLRAASVLGRDVSLELLGAIAPEELAALDDASASGVVRAVGDDRLRFSHMLLRDELYQSLDPDSRGALHRAAARASTSRELVAHHALEGARSEDAEPTLDLVLAAMHEAAGRFAHEDAARLGQRAMGRLAPALAKPRMATLQVAVAEALMLAGDIPAAQALAEQAAALSAELASAELLARAALTRAAEIPFSGDRVASSWLRRALDLLPAGDSALRVELMARLAAAMHNEPGGLSERARLIADAVAIARHLGDERALLTALHNAAGSFPDHLTPRERFALFAETVDLAEATGTVGKIAPLLAWHVVTWLELFEPAQALLAVDRVERLLLPYTRPHYRWRPPLIRALQLAIAGRFDEAEKLAFESLGISRAHNVVEGMTMFAIYYTSLPYLRGDDRGLAGVMPEIERAFAALPFSDIFRALCDAPLGRTNAVRRSFRLLEKLDVRHVPGVKSLGWACARAGLLEHAEFCFQLTVQFPSNGPLVFSPGGYGCVGPQALLVARLAAMTGRRELALASFQEASAQARELRSPPFIAQCELGLAKLLHAGSARAAAEHAARALEAARSVGLDDLAKRAEALLDARPAATKAAPVGTPSTALAEPQTLCLRREGDVWSLQAGTGALQLTHSKGLGYLDMLVDVPHRPVHALELSGIDDRHDSGPVLDEQAKRAYKARATELQAALAEAAEHNDRGRAERLQAELDALSEELTRAFGLGGRARMHGSVAERARINVQRRLRDVIRRVAELDPRLGRHLELSVRTGNFCVYSPTWPRG